MSTKENLKKYFMQVSGNKKFAEEMTKEIYSFVKKEASQPGSTTLVLFGTDLERVALKTDADLSTYFQPGDLDVFEMDVSVTNGEITGIVYVDAPRKQPVSIEA